jgi:pimeloyl-ACP methyl ester carboxylesterase
MLRVFVEVVMSLFGAWVALDRLVAWRVGRKPKFGFQGATALGNAFQQLQMFVQPRVENVVVQMVDEDADDEDAGDEAHPEAARRHLLRQAERIRRGTLEGPLTTRMEAPAWRVRPRGGAWMRRFGLAMCVWVGVVAMGFGQATQVASGGASAANAAMAGTWAGALDVGVMKLRLVFHVSASEAGLTATMDSPDQGAKGIPVSSVMRDGDAFKLEIAAAHASFAGTISKDGTTITGTWTQGANALPLVLTSVKGDAAKVEGERLRPQNPTRPYPYKEVEVSYRNPSQGDTLAGTLTIPEGKGPFTAVLLITGSGPQDRDETLLGHKPFLVLSDYLTRRGIAVLRVDDRGIGKSTGTFAGATTADFATDVEAGVAFLKTRPEVNPAKIGLIGHSEGGIIAPMVAARDKDVAFIVMMSGSGVPGYEVILEQAKLIEEGMGVPAAKAEADEAEHRADYELILKNQGLSEPGLEALLKAKLAHDGVPVAEANALVAQVSGPWFRYFLAYDPRLALRQLRLPVLALIGSKDLQVVPEQNLPALREALKDDPKAEVLELPGLNHLYQTAKTGLPSEYQEIEETIAPLALKTIGDWVVKQ